MHSENKTALRKIMRSKRQNLSAAQQRRAAQFLFFKLSKHKVFKNAERIGFYFSNDGEISVDLLFHHAVRLRKKCYFPCIDKNNTLQFRQFISELSLRKNKFGILEPNATAPRIEASQLDLVFAPLVAWSISGKRLGMGGGFYDRCFAFKLKKGKTTPILIGTAHHCQKANAIDTEAWDIPMDMIASDQLLMNTSTR